MARGYRRHELLRSDWMGEDPDTAADIIHAARMGENDPVVGLQ